MISVNLNVNFISLMNLSQCSSITCSFLDSIFCMFRPVCDAVVKVLDIRNEMICCQLLALIKSIIGSVDYKVTIRIYTHNNSYHSNPTMAYDTLFNINQASTFCIVNLMRASHNFVYICLNGLCVCNIHEL